MTPPRKMQAPPVYRPQTAPLQRQPVKATPHGVMQRAAAAAIPPAPAAVVLTGGWVHRRASSSAPANLYGDAFVITILDSAFRHEFRTVGSIVNELNANPRFSAALDNAVRTGQGRVQVAGSSPLRSILFSYRAGPPPEITIYHAQRNEGPSPYSSGKADASLKWR
jgi:hypothetical protein